MAYVDTAGSGTRGPAVIGVAAVHAIMAVVVVTGLAGSVAQIIPRTIIGTFDVPKPRPLPPPVDRPLDDGSKTITRVVMPDKPFDLDQPSNPVDGTDEAQHHSTPVTTTTGNGGTGDGFSDGGGKIKDPPRLFDPVAPQARNGNWVTDNDYRTSWINRKWEGTVAFRLSIGNDGRVRDCTVTQSTGHAALDDATCALVKRRAKFDPARNERGETVAGSFSSAVRWQIPD